MRPHDLEEPHGLIMDQHSTHCSYDLLHYPEDHHVTIYHLPPHANHFLRPIDCALFRPLKQAYHAAEEASVWAGTPTERHRIPVLFGTAWKRACTVSNVKVGFRNSAENPVWREVEQNGKLLSWESGALASRQQWNWK